MVTDGNSLCGNAKGEIFHRRKVKQMSYVLLKDGDPLYVGTFSETERKNAEADGFRFVRTKEYYEMKIKKERKVM